MLNTEIQQTKTYMLNTTISQIFLQANFLSYLFFYYWLFEQLGEKELFIYKNCEKIILSRFFCKGKNGQTQQTKSRKFLWIVHF